MGVWDLEGCRLAPPGRSSWETVGELGRGRGGVEPRARRARAAGRGAYRVVCPCSAPLVAPRHSRPWTRLEQGTEEQGTEVRLGHRSQSPSYKVQTYK